MFPFGAVTVSVMSPFLSVDPLTSIVVEPSTPPAFNDRPRCSTEVVIVPVFASMSEITMLLIESDYEELPPETSTSTDRLYFEDAPWFTLTVAVPSSAFIAHVALYSPWSTSN